MISLFFNYQFFNDLIIISVELGFHDVHDTMTNGRENIF